MAKLCPDCRMPIPAECICEDDELDTVAPIPFREPDFTPEDAA